MRTVTCPDLLSAPMRARAGFSLIELAMVLAIIGLVVGGIYAGQSYIRNAQVSSTINKSKLLMNAFGQFQARYAAIPGDMANATNFWSGTFNGDGNGFIRAGATASPIEALYAFQHLALGQFIEGSYTGATTGGVGTVVGTPGTNIPAAANDAVGYWFDHPDALDGTIDTASGTGDATYFDGLYFHVLRVAAVTAGGMPTTAFMTPQEQLALDIKFDDGKPGSGWIESPKSSAQANCASSDTASSATYLSAIDSKTCSLVLKMQ